MSSITETLKSKLDDLDLDRRVDELTVVAEKAVKRAVGHVGELAHDNRERVAGLLDKAGSAIDERTDGKYATQVDKVRTQVVAGVDKLATKRPASGNDFSDAPADTPQDAPTSWARHTDEV
ncbi:MAG: antitoxin [Candidatus Phosphoribacter sp.]|nr:antitoxin [Actinomycetales bacterium]